jgi:ProP effector
VYKNYDEVALDLIALLIGRFPLCFRSYNPVPIKINIVNDIEVRHGDLPRSLLLKAIGAYTGTDAYGACLRAGAIRIDLDGKPCGFVQEEHVLASHARNNTRDTVPNIRDTQSNNPANGI